jgi:hypothetical protein
MGNYLSKYTNGSSSGSVSAGKSARILSLLKIAGLCQWALSLLSVFSLNDADLIISKD